MENAAAAPKDRPSFFRRARAGLDPRSSLAPLMAELLPGATRFGAIFVFPIEMCVWGGGALLVRELVRRKGLGWASMLCLALVLALAEECVIQQTSLAPLVIQLKGQVYARAFGVNYVYLVWALIYEAAFVVLLPVLLAECSSPRGAAQAWMSLAGTIVTLVLFVLGEPARLVSAWTHIARVQVFHLPAFDPPLVHVRDRARGDAGPGPARLRSGPELGEGGAAAALVALAARPRRALCGRSSSSGSACSPSASRPMSRRRRGGRRRGAGGGGDRARAALRRASEWSDLHGFGLFAGALIGMMGAMFLGFIGAAPADLWFKLVTNALASALAGLVRPEAEAPLGIGGCTAVWGSNGRSALNVSPSLPPARAESGDSRPHGRCR